MADLKKEGEQVANRLAQAVPEGTDISAVLIGIAAFLAYVVNTAYDLSLAKQAIVSNANLSWDMVQRMNRPEVEGEYEEEEGEPKVTLQ
jgi:hypothetical protein